MPTLTLKDVGKGLNRDLPPSELGSGYWNDKFEAAAKSFADAENRARAMVPLRTEFPAFRRGDRFNINRGY